MKPETLEVLLLDRAMGELPPEVVELLETHLTHNPEAARQADQWASTLQLARQAVAMVPEVPRRPLAVERLRQARATQRRWSIAWGFAKLAACVAFGLTLGWYGRALRQAPVMAVASPATTRTSSMIAGTLPPDARENAIDFWSLSGLAAAQQSRQSVESRATNRYRLHWDSPVRMPRVEENL